MLRTDPGDQGFRERAKLTGTCKKFLVQRILSHVLDNLWMVSWSSKFCPSSEGLDPIFQ